MTSTFPIYTPVSRPQGFRLDLTRGSSRDFRFTSLLALALGASLVGCASSGKDSHEPSPVSQQAPIVSTTDVVVDWSDVKQTMSGFGASSAWFGVKISDADADSLFDAKIGIGLSLLRAQIGLPADTRSDGKEPVTGAVPVATAPDLATAKQALARGAKVWATAWTPPPAWKTTNSKNGSGKDFTSNVLQPEHYQDYANYLADFVDLMKGGGVPLIALSAQNEPDYVASWDGAEANASMVATFVGQYLGPTFATRCPDVKIVSPDTAHWDNLWTGNDMDYYDALMNDPDAKKYTAIVATHPYPVGDRDPNLQMPVPSENGKEFWQTEWSQENKVTTDTPDPSMVSAIDMVQHIHDHLTIANMNSWNWWAIYTTKDNLNDKNRMNPALIQPDATLGTPYMFKRGYAFGNWSKFVRPGFIRIGATDTPTEDVLVEAYRDDTHIAIIAVNATNDTVTQKFTLTDGTFGTVTPWVTSETDSLAAKTPITATDNFTFDLPNQSVVTFVNWDATIETPDPLNPGTGGASGTGDASVEAGTTGGGVSVTNENWQLAGGGFGCRIGGKPSRTRTIAGLGLLGLVLLGIKRRRTSR